MKRCFRQIPYETETAEKAPSLKGAFFYPLHAFSFQILIVSTFIPSRF